MRPLQLEMHGFGAFSAPTTVDFRGHELIAFTGPTGAGKSTIIDGIVFALYGSVARYDNEKLVAPVINAVSSEARVRLDFSIGTAEYTAIRVVRRTSNGASTKEARLEHGEEVLASTAQEVTTEVERLLGLSFNQFTKTVVLPQGDFARFLTEKSSTRQRLLRRLLGLELFAELGKAARQRSRDIATEGQAFQRAVKEGATISADDLEALQTEVEELDAVASEAEALATERSALREELDDRDANIDDLDGQIEALAALKVPAEVRSFATDVGKAASALAIARKKKSSAEANLDKARDARATLPERAETEEAVENRQRLAVLSDASSQASEAFDDAAKTLEVATAAAQAAAAELTAANERVEASQISAGAQGIAASLHVGDQCPVCDQRIDDLPTHPDHGDLAEQVELCSVARDNAAERAAEAVEEVRAATADHAEHKARLTSIEEMRSEIADLLKGRPTEKQALAVLKRLDAADAKIEAAAQVVEDLATLVDEMAERLAEAEDEGARLRRQFTIARDSVARLEPPAPTEEALADDWAAIVSWAKEQTSRAKAERREQSKQITVARKGIASIEASMLRLSRVHTAPGATPDPDDSVALLRNAHADARIVLANTRDRYERQELNRVRLGELEREQAIAGELGKHLASGMFERWIMADVMLDLAERATTRLNELSAGAYSLTTDGKDFQIRDHRNADELRSAKTLSGGETFLTSLALALALAESITDLASTVTPPLESMFLDEGFGTLDSETLDTVAAAIEDLGASGRMIGIVTHIRELAERLPSRFAVQRTANGSAVEAIG